MRSGNPKYIARAAAVNVARGYEQKIGQAIEIADCRRVDDERRDDPDELLQLQVPVTSGAGAIPLTSLLATPTVYVLDFSGGGDMAAAQRAEGAAAEANASVPGGSSALLAQLALNDQRNFTVLSDTRAELTVPAGEPLPRQVEPSRHP
mgnify:CR=1 FL=1